MSRATTRSRVLPLSAALLLLAGGQVRAQVPSPPTPLQLAIRQLAALNTDGRTADARAGFQHLIDSLPTPLERSQAQRAMAMSYAFQGDCAGTARYERLVIDYWKTREAAEPQNAFFQQGEVANEAARVCIDAGSLDSAESLYRLGYQLANQEPAPRTHVQALWDFRLAHALGRLAARRGNATEARVQVAAARRALDADTAVASQQERFFPYLVGYVAFYTNDFAAAEREFTRGIAMRGNEHDPFQHALLAQTYEKLGRPEDAQLTWEKAYEYATGNNPPSAYARPLARTRLSVTLDYDRREAMIPMRDGVKLYTIIFTPKGAAGPLPILFRRTPYGVGPLSIRAAAPTGSLYELAQDHGGYIFAFGDIRGRHKSEGQFVMNRPPRLPGSGPTGVDEGTDAYDTIDWLVKNVANTNGRVGMFGVSYDGWTTEMALLEPHPALKAASPQASPADMFLGDDFHHNGAFRLAYGFEYATMMETDKDQTPFQFDRYDTYDWYLNVGPLSNLNAKYLHGTIPSWNDFVAHPNYDAFWQRQAVWPYFAKAPTVPTLNVAGWWDQEDFYGPVRIYLESEKHDTAHLNFLVVGPWRHGGWDAPDGDRLGNIDFGSPTARYFREHIEAPFFAFYLKDEGTLRQPEAITFEAGANEWKSWDAWPPRDNVSPRMLYFGANGTLAFAKPVTQNGQRSTALAGAFDSYVSDPRHPVPYRARPIQWTYDDRGSGWYTWLTEDQRFVDNRPDVLTYQTAPLTDDVEIAGDVLADLNVATTGSDLDLIVKLIDVYPDSMPDARMGGYEFMVSNEVFRGRFRDGFTTPKPLTPNRVTHFSYSLRTQSYKFKRGHRIMVQVQSTWFPIIDRNPQTFVPNIFEARESDFRAATVRVSRSAGAPSGVVLPVVTHVAP